MFGLIVFGTLVVGAQSETHPGVPQYVNWRELRLPCAFTTEGTAPVAGLRLWWARNGGGSWHAFPETGLLKPQPFVTFTAPSDGTYAFVLQAIDSAGNTSEAPSPQTVADLLLVVDTHRPTVDVISPGETQRLRSGQMLTVEWVVRDEHLPPTPLEIFCLEDDQDPVPVGAGTYPAEGELLWRVPPDARTVSFLFSAEDRAGNHEEVERGPFAILTLLEKGTVSAEAASGERTVPVHYRFPSTDPGAIGGIELYYAHADRPGEPSPWQFSCSDGDQAPPVVFHAPRDGLFKLYVAVKADDGKTYLRSCSDRSEPDAVVLVDTCDPDVVIRSVSGVSSGLVELAGGDGADIEIMVNEMHLPDRAVNLEYSTDNGRTWHGAAGDLSARPGRPFVHTWTVPNTPSASLFLRARACDAAGRVGYGEFPGRIRVHDMPK